MFLFEIVFNDSCFGYQKGGDICFFVEKQFLLSFTFNKKFINCVVGYGIQHATVYTQN